MDPQTKKLYKAEHNCCSLAEIVPRYIPMFVSNICRGKLWQARFKGTKLFIYYLRRNVNIAYGGVRTKDGKPFIAIPQNPHGRQVHTIVHEMAHALAGAQRKSHGTAFLRILLKLMTEYEGREYAQDLRKELIKQKLLSK